MRHKPVFTLHDFRDLDESEVLLGYMAGFENERLNAAERSRSFVHGWRNGQLAAGYRAPDAADQSLATAMYVLA